MRIATNVHAFPEDTTTSVPRVDAVNKYPLPDKVAEVLSDMCREEEAPSGTYKMGYDSPLWRVGIGVCLQLGEVLMHEEIGGSSCVLFYILDHEEIAALGLNFSDVLWCCKPYISVTETAKLPQWKGWLEHLRIKNKMKLVTSLLVACRASVLSGRVNVTRSISFIQSAMLNLELEWNTLWLVAPPPPLSCF